MTTHAPMARVPFAPLDNPRLQHLASAKNRQNGLTSKNTLSSGKPAMSLTSPTKRKVEPAIFDDFDGENVDPAGLSSPSKKSKSDVSEKPFKPFTFTMTPSKAMPPPPSRLSTPARANISSPRAPLTAPAGRSPTKRKGAGLLNTKNRRTSAPFSRIDPPCFNASRTSSSLPFSLDAALSGTFSNSTPTTPSNKMGAGATIAESMPKNWFFEIYEDTPEEEASNLMEHSTLTLDLSSDEESEKKSHDKRGKENMPPEGYDAVTASRTAGVVAATETGPARVKKTEIVRKKVVVEEMDDGERSPLASLETDPFIPEGLDKEAHVIVDALTEKVKDETKSLFAGPMPFTAGLHGKRSSISSLVNTPIISSGGDVKGEIIVWEDSSSSEAQVSSAEVSPKTVADNSMTKAADAENTQPTAKDVEL